MSGKVKFACEPGHISDFQAGHFNVAGIMTVSGATGYWLDVDVFTKDQKPDCKVRLIIGDGSGGFPSGLHFIESWRAPSSNMSQVLEPGDCCEDENQHACFQATDAALDKKLVTARDQYLQKHARRFSKLRGGASSVAYDRAGKEQKFMAAWIDTTMVVGEMGWSRVTNSIPDENKKRITLEYITDRETGLTYVAYSYQKPETDKQEPPAFFAGFKEGQPVFFVHNKQNDGRFLITAK